MSASQIARDPTREPSNAGVFGGRALLAFIVGIPAVYLLVIAIAWNHVGPRDLDQFVVFHELQIWNMQLSGFAKQWAPVLCSGVSLAGEPQVPLLSLSMLIAYGLGALRGLQWAMILYLALGWLGAYLYAGLWLTKLKTRALAAALFIGNGFFVCRLAYGHMDFLPFLMLPLALWILHRTLHEQPASIFARPRQFVLHTLLLAAIASLAIDGSPVSLIHLFFWIGLYALVLSVVRRSPLPIVTLGLALAASIFLTAGYLWPMLDAQAEFPRRTPDTFTNPLALLWFALLPIRGKLITPATGNGHELSVFIGPVVAYAVWRFRATLSGSLPNELKWPLLVVSVVSIWLGMGSLRVLHVPVLLSPFDWLRPLPGFRSLWVTGRFWGFLALPLSLLGAAALVEFAASDITAKRKKIAFACAVGLQFGFQIATLYSLWSDGHPYRPIAPAQFAATGETIRYTRCDSKHYQGEFITPTQGVVNCYDNDDFIRVQFDPDAPLVKSIERDGGSPIHAQAVFMSWNHIRIRADAEEGAEPFTIVFNQSYNKHWSSPQCSVANYADGFLSMRCPGSAAGREIEVVFDNALSTRAASIALTSWKIWGVAFGLWVIAWGSSKVLALRRMKPVRTSA